MHQDFFFKTLNPIFLEIKAARQRFFASMVATSWCFRRGICCNLLWYYFHGSC